MKKRVIAAVVGLLFLVQSVISAAAGFPFQPNTVLNAADLNTALQTAAITSGTIDSARITNSPISGNTGSFTSLTSPSVSFTGGLIDNIPIGTTTPVAGTFTTASAVTGVFGSATISGSLTSNGLFTANGAISSLGITAASGINNTGSFTGAYTDGTVVDYTIGNGRISVGTNDTLTLYNGGVGNTQLAQFTAAGMIVGNAANAYGYVSHRYDIIQPSGRAVNIGAASDTIATGSATTFESANTASGVFTVTLAVPAFDGERRRICFKNITGTITWNVTAPATGTNGLPTTVAAGQCVELIYNAAAGSPVNSTATTWYVY